MKRLPLFDDYAIRFGRAEHPLFMVGGTSRDLLLNLEVRDFDFVSDATPEETLAILGEGDATFAKFGTITLRKHGLSMDFMTFREEGEYRDYRHPAYIRFVRDMATDSLRRDFTINALYIDADYQVHDFHNGLSDLKHHLIRFIGDPNKRIQEDPLRILRARRFARRLGFKLEEETAKAIQANEHLLTLLNPEKVMMEEKKE